MGALPSAIKCAPPCADNINYSTQLIANNYCHSKSGAIVNDSNNQATHHHIATMLSHPNSAVLAAPAVGSGVDSAPLASATHVVAQTHTQQTLSAPAHHTQQSATVAMSQLGTVYATKRRRRNGKRFENNSFIFIKI